MTSVTNGECRIEWFWIFAVYLLTAYLISLIFRNPENIA